MTTTSIEPGYFRDRTNRVFYHEGAVLRGLNGRALSEWEALSSTDFFQRLLAEGKIVPTARVSPGELRDANHMGDWAGVLRHERNAEGVIAMDADHLVIERLYDSLKGEHRQTILPLVSNLVDPSPRLGWRGTERGTLADRGRPSLTLCLALIHHVAITANIPISNFVEWLRGLETCLVIEFVTRDDSMVRTLLRNKRDDYDDYDTAHFERCLGDGFDVVRRSSLSSGTRILYYCTPRSS